MRISPTSLTMGLSFLLLFMALLNFTWISSNSFRFGKTRFNSSVLRHCLFAKGFIKTISSTLRFRTCDLSVWNNSEMKKAKHIACSQISPNNDSYDRIPLNWQTAGLVKIDKKESNFKQLKRIFEFQLCFYQTVWADFHLFHRHIQSFHCKYCTGTTTTRTDTSLLEISKYHICTSSTSKITESWNCNFSTMMHATKLQKGNLVS